MFILYKLVFASGKAYIGQTVRSMETRIAQHKRLAKSGSNLAVHCAWRKYGDPDVSIIAEYESQDQLNAAEVEFIASMNTLSPNGYNLGHGGENAPSKNPEVARKISQKAKGRKHDDTSCWVESSKRNWQDDCYRKKVSAGLKASWTDEARAKRSEMMKKIWAERKAAGFKVSEETKKKLSYKRSDETRARMSESAKKRERTPVTDETRKKLSQSIAESWKNDEVRQKRIEAIKSHYVTTGDNDAVDQRL